MDKLYLSRRNLFALLSKLDRVKAGQVSKCMIEKNDPYHPHFPQSMQSISVVAVEIDDAYAAQPKCHLNLSRQSIFELYKQLDSGQSAKMQIAGLTVYAIEDEEYYKDRIAGFILPVDDPTTEKVLH